MKPCAPNNDKYDPDAFSSAYYVDSNSGSWAECKDIMFAPGYERGSLM